MEGEHRLIADGEARGVRLDVWLVRRLPSLSRARLQSLVDEGLVLLDGHVARPSTRLREGQTVTVRVPPVAPAAPGSPAAPATVRSMNWTVDAVAQLYELPFNDLLYRAQRVHRAETRK